VIERVVDDHINSVNQDVFGNISGIQPAVLKRAVADGMREGLKSANWGSGGVKGSIVSKIKEVAPGVDDGLAGKIADELNRKL